MICESQLECVGDALPEASEASGADRRKIADADQAGQVGISRDTTTVNTVHLSQRICTQIFHAPYLIWLKTF